MDRNPFSWRNDGTAVWCGPFCPLHWVTMLTQHGPAYLEEIFPTGDEGQRTAAGASLPCGFPGFLGIRQEENRALSNSMGPSGWTMQCVSLKLLPSSSQGIERLHKAKWILGNDQSTVLAICCLYFSLAQRKLACRPVLRFNTVASCWPKEIIPIALLLSVPPQFYFSSTPNRNLPGLTAGCIRMSKTHPENQEQLSKNISEIVWVFKAQAINKAQRQDLTDCQSPSLLGKRCVSHPSLHLPTQLILWDKSLWERCSRKACKSHNINAPCTYLLRSVFD